MSPSPPELSAFIQAQLRIRGVEEVEAVAAAKWLDRAGLLRDSPSRPGKPLRDMLRAGLVGHAEQRPPQPHGRWFILRAGSAASSVPAAGRARPEAGEIELADSVDEVIEAPRDTPVCIPCLSLASLPCAGLYSWWRVGTVLPAVPGVPHPSLPGLDLIYVGIGPKTSRSKETLRGRLVGKHVEGNTGSSTLRLSLAAHLMTELSLRPRATLTKVVLDRDDNTRLTQWMEEHLRVAWVAHQSPWGVETRVIREMSPPLNVDHNHDHHYCATNQALRMAFRRAARR